MNISKHQLGNFMWEWRDSTKEGRYLKREGGLPSFIDFDPSELWINFMTGTETHRWNGPSEYFLFSDYDKEPEDYNAFSWHIRDIYLREKKVIDYFEFLDHNGIDINNITDNDIVLIEIWLAGYERN